jgi:hypothetical protein
LWHEFNFNMKFFNVKYFILKITVRVGLQIRIDMLFAGLLT